MTIYKLFGTEHPDEHNGKKFETENTIIEPRKTWWKFYLLEFRNALCSRLLALLCLLICTILTIGFFCLSAIHCAFIVLSFGRLRNLIPAMKQCWNYGTGGFSLSIACIIGVFSPILGVVFALTYLMLITQGSPTTETLQMLQERIAFLLQQLRR